MTNNFGNNITELRRLFDDMLEENRLVLRRKRDEASEGAYNVSSLRRIIDVILDEVGYLKTEQTFDRLHAIGNGPMASPPYLGAIHSKSERSPYAAPRAVEVDLCGFFCGQNWHQAEWDEPSSRGFRWTDGATGWIEMRVDRHCPLVVEFECLCVASSATYEDVSIVVDDQVLATRWAEAPAPRRSVLFSCVLPPSEALSGVSHRFGLRCRKPVRPSDVDPDSRDERELGVAGLFFRIYPETSRAEALEKAEEDLGAIKGVAMEALS